MPPKLLSESIIFLSPFESRTEERTLPWLPIAPAPQADAGSRTRFTRTLLADGWLPVSRGDTPAVDTWSVRIVDDLVWLRQSLSPHSTGQRDERFRQLIVEQQALHLVYNPMATPFTNPAALALSPFAICARVPLTS